MNHHTISLLLLSGLPLLAQGINSNLPRGDAQLSTVPGVHNDAAANTDAGFGMFRTAAPKQDLPDRAGGLVATSRLVHNVYADFVNGNVVIQYARSTDGGRTFGTPISVYTCDTAGGEDLAGSAAEELQLYCHEDAVYVTVNTNKDNLVAFGQSVYAVGSADQGQTWSAPVLVSPGIGTTRFDVDEQRGAATSTGLHMVYEWDYAASVTGNENFAYARLGFTGGVFGVQIPSTDITTFADGTFDVNNPNVAANGNVVMLIWKDDSDPALLGQSQVYSIVSFDGGATFGAPFNHTQFTAPLTWAEARQPYCFLDGPHAYVFMEDSRVDQDDVWMDRGDVDPITGTVNWNQRGIMCSDIPAGGPAAAGQLDVDGMLVDVQDGVIAILYRDDRLAPNNSNWARMAVDRTGGNDFIAGTASHHLLNARTATLYDLDIARNVICAVWEECSGQEEGAIALSHDRGLTFSSSQFTTLGSCSSPAGVIDVDDLRCSVSLNGDYDVLYVDERFNNNNTGNHCFRTGGKYPALRNPLLANGTIDMSKVDPVQASGGIGFLMISGGGTVPGHAVLGNTDGFFVGLQNDLWFQLLLQSAPSLFTGISPTGDASFTIPGGIPNLSALLGFPVHCAAGTLAYGPRLFVSYTDPLLFQ